MGLPDPTPTYLRGQILSPGKGDKVNYIHSLPVIKYLFRVMYVQFGFSYLLFTRPKFTVQLTEHGRGHLSTSGLFRASCVLFPRTNNRLHTQPHTHNHTHTHTQTHTQWEIIGLSAVVVGGSIAQHNNLANIDPYRS